MKTGDVQSEAIEAISFLLPFAQRHRSGVFRELKLSFGTSDDATTRALKHHEIEELDAKINAAVKALANLRNCGDDCST